MCGVIGRSKCSEHSCNERMKRKTENDSNTKTLIIVVALLLLPFSINLNDFKVMKKAVILEMMHCIPMKCQINDNTKLSGYFRSSRRISNKKPPANSNIP